MDQGTQRTVKCIDSITPQLMATQQLQDRQYSLDSVEINSRYGAHKL